MLELVQCAVTQESLQAKNILNEMFLYHSDPCCGHSELLIAGEFDIDGGR